MVLTGEVGTGKTTMLECLQDFLAANRIEYAYLFNSRLTVERFFEMIACDLDLRCARTSKTEVLIALNQLLIEFDRKLDAPSLRQLKQRISLRCTLKPLQEAETSEYISTRLGKAGMSEQTVFPLELIAEIHVRSQGIRD
ncbi:MAG: AAA family ATPase [Bryobacteraceae bacterium]